MILQAENELCCLVSFVERNLDVMLELLCSYCLIALCITQSSGVVLLLKLVLRFDATACVVIIRYQCERDEAIHNCF